MSQPNTTIPTAKTVKRDFETGTVQPGPGMAPDRPPAEDMQGPGASEEFKAPDKADKANPSGQTQKPAGGCCGCS